MLECRNPNYLRVIGKEVRFITREEFIASEDNDRRKNYEVRCGKCLSCKLYKSYQQANRLMLEAIHNEWTWFTTLTYDEEHYDEAAIMLDPLRDSQLFIKRLRKMISTNYHLESPTDEEKELFKIKFYTTLERGTERGRLHYHIIIFSRIDHFPDMYKWRYNEDENKWYYSSPTLRKLWGKGDVQIDFANYDQLRYAANYVQDAKQSVKHSFSQGIGDEYLHMHLDGSNAVIQGKTYMLTKAQREKLGVEKEEYVFDKQFMLSKKEREIKNRQLAKTFYRKG